MCDSNKSSIDYFNRHLDLMRKMGQCADYTSIDNVESFFARLERESL